jgi:Na+/melibiose symporter-like transporter
MNKTTRVYELVDTLLIMAVCIFMLITTFNTPTSKNVEGLGSMDFPIAIFIIVICFCTIVIVKNILLIMKTREIEKTQTEEQKLKNRFVKIDKRICNTIILIVMYVFMWNIIGFSFSTLLYFAVQAKALNKQNSWLLCAVIGVATVLFVNLVFVKLFMMKFPEPLFEMFLG